MSALRATQSGVKREKQTGRDRVVWGPVLEVPVELACQPQNRSWLSGRAPRASGAAGRERERERERGREREREREAEGERGREREREGGRERERERERVLYSSICVITIACII